MAGWSSGRSARRSPSSRANAARLAARGVARGVDLERDPLASGAIESLEDTRSRGRGDLAHHVVAAVEQRGCRVAASFAGFREVPRAPPARPPRRRRRRRQPEALQGPDQRARARRDARGLARARAAARARPLRPFRSAAASAPSATAAAPASGSRRRHASSTRAAWAGSTGALEERGRSNRLAGALPRDGRVEIAPRRFEHARGPGVVPALGQVGRGSLRAAGIRGQRAPRPHARSRRRRRAARARARGAPRPLAGPRSRRCASRTLARRARSPPPRRRDRCRGAPPRGAAPRGRAARRRRPRGTSLRLLRRRRGSAPGGAPRARSAASTSIETTNGSIGVCPRATAAASPCAAMSGRMHDSLFFIRGPL